MSELPTTQRQAAERLVDIIGRQEVPEDRGLARGASVARYTVLEPIGHGGLGDVYRVYDPKLDRCVALKLIRASFGDRDGAAKRLEREAKALAALDHPNVVTVFDFGIDDNRLYVAMECIEGRTLRAWLVETPRSWQEIRDIFVEAGTGLAAAHRAGLVHRDFKPDNVLVDSDEDRVRVVDFGLARSATEAARLGPASAPSGMVRLDGVTPSGTVVGTPRYMPPEQLQGGAAEARSDQFAFCVALFHALYGQWPFAGDGLQAQAEAIAAQQIPRTKNSLGAPPWLKRALVRGLAADPTRRHPSMDDLLHALLRDRRSRRRRWWSALVSAGVGAAIAAFAILGPAELTDDQAMQLAAIEARARQAALDGRFVYPGTEADAGSALEAVLALEQSEIPNATDHAATLRAEFADRLIDLGDEVGALPGGRAFASDYYAAALVFDPDRREARQGTVLTPGEVATLRGQAAQGEFSPRELAAGELLARLASEGERPLQQRVQEALQDSKGPPSRVAKRPEPRPGSPSEGSPEAEAEPPAEPERTEPSPGTDSEPGPATHKASRPAPRDQPAAPATEVDPEGLKASLAAGRAALGRAAFAEAEKHFHRALAASPRSPAALSGLAEVHFERYAYGEAKKFAQRATTAAPNNARYRVQLGDAHYKLTDYRAARAAWEEAVRLGSKRAKGRLDKLDKKLGSD